MFKIMAMICFMGVGNLQQHLCFNASIPHEFKGKAECMQYVKMTINKLDADFKKRKVTMALKCVLHLPAKKQKIKIPRNKSEWSA
jgi:hypothetical protein